MAKLTRVTSKVFGSEADPNIVGDPEISQFGSALAQTFLGTDDVAQIQELPAWSQGWIGAVTSNQQFPALSEMTGAMKVLSYQSAYNQQMGIAEWDNDTTYYKNSFCQVDGTIYKSLTDDNIGNNPVGDNTNWTEFKSGGGNNIFDIKWSDHIINDIQWLRADTFSWQSGSVYVTAYNKLVEEYATGTEETEGDITFKRTTNGFKITTADYADAVLEKYNTDGIAWYYILDTANTQFKLPRTKFGFEGLRDNVGDDIDESLPNIKGSSTIMWVGADSTASGAISNTGLKNPSAGNFATGTINKYTSIVFDASNSSSTYQDNAPVQERATQMYLYFYVGNYSQTAIEQTAGITTEQLNNKLDLSGTTTATSVDGQWVCFTETNIASNVDATKDASYDLSSYLPDDNYVYEILIQGLVNTGTTSGNLGRINISTSELPRMQIATTITRTSSYMRAGATAVIPIGTDRTLNYVYVSGATGTYYLYLHGYRRIGTNE